MRNAEESAPGARGVRARPALHPNSATVAAEPSVSRLEAVELSTRPQTTIEAARSLVGPSLLLLAGTTTLNLCAYLFHLVSGRLLGPGEFGVVAAIAAMTYVLSLPLSGLQLTVAKFGSVAAAHGHPNSMRGVVISTLSLAFPLAVFVGLLIMVLSWPMSRALNMSSVTPVLLLGAMVPVLILLSIARGALQGWQRFGLLGLNVSLEGVCRAGLVAPLVFVGLGASGPILALLLASLAAASFAFLPLRRLRHDDDDVALLGGGQLAGYAGSAFLVMILFAGFISFDLIFAKAALPERDAGIYAAAIILTRVIFFASDAVAGVMFPRTASLHGLGKDATQALAGALGIVVGASLALLVPFLVAPRFLVSALFGGEFLEGAIYLRPLAIASVLMAVCNVLVAYQLSRGRVMSLVAVGLVFVAQAIGLVMFHGGIGDFVTVKLLSTVLLALVFGSWLFGERLTARRGVR